MSNTKVTILTGNIIIQYRSIYLVVQPNFRKTHNWNFYNVSGLWLKKSLLAIFGKSNTYLLIQVELRAL